VQAMRRNTVKDSIIEFLKEIKSVFIM